MADSIELANRFTYHPALTDRRRNAHDSVRAAVAAVAVELNNLVPEGREKALAFTKLEEAMLWANAALARTPDTGEAAR
ncbi:DUF7681 family protein [Nocardia cyriacigeorgica]|uniref:Acb2/Tad1 domain-containing protein n=1 Tax=Nocardia cyriacigeorgica TaxID=135487 RepID=UPI0024573F75|nr:hypothetical protein [Nocardia cyriacigeorgica]